MKTRSSIRLTEKVKITIALCISVIILIALGVFANSKTVKYKESMSDFHMSGIIITQSQDVLTAVMDVQSAYKGYIMTNDSSFLKPFEIANMFVKSRVGSLKSISMTYKQRLLLDSISKLIDEQKEIAYSVIVKRKYASFLESWRYLNSGEENRIVNKLRYNIQNFITTEKALQSAKLKKENDNFNKVIYVVTISVIAAVLIILFTLYYIRKIYTRLINTERLLLKSQLRLESILDKLPIGVIIANANNNEYHVNDKAVKLLGGQLFPNGKVPEMPDKTYTFKEGLRHELSQHLFISHAIQGEENIGFNETTIHVNDHKVPFRVSAIPLYNDKGEIEYAISVFDDISNIKEFENQLIEAKKLVEESLKLKESFLSNMSHEIRTPINAILGFAELLDKKDIGEQENEYVRIIRSAGENLLRLLNDILDFSKLESNMMVFEEHPVSIDGILNSICNLFLPKAKAKNITLNYECDKDIPDVVIGDPVRLTQVIVNIVGNAIKFTPKGSILMFAKLVSINEKQSVIEFKIKDSGIGISKDKLSRVFKRFEQAGVETTRLYGGTGLGLSIAKHIVQSQGGEISVTSELGVGSIFTFTMPFKNWEPNQFSNTKTVESVTNLSFLEGLKILLVEDNVLNIKLIQGVFLGTKIILDVAETGAQTINKLSNPDYDIILMDIELPDMSGYQITKMIRNELNLNLPIIALTAHALAGEKEKCMEAGMNDYLTKPVNTKQLFEKINLLVKSANRYPISFLEEPQHIPTNSDVTASGELNLVKQSLVDLSYLREFSDDNKEFEKELIEMFISQAPSQLQELEVAIDNRDYNVVKMVAHKLKSSVAITMGKKLSVHFELLEEHAVNQDFSTVTFESFDTIKQVLGEGLIELEEIINSDEYSV